MVKESQHKLMFWERALMVLLWLWYCATLEELKR